MNRHITVPGVPQTKGNVIKGRWGGYHDANKRLGGWMHDLAAAMVDAGWATDPILMGPVALSCTFHMPRPKSHLRADGTLRPNAPAWHDKRGDLDKLLRAVGDALTASGAIRDDAQIATIAASKRYALAPGVDIHLEQVGQSLGLTPLEKP